MHLTHSIFICRIKEVFFLNKKLFYITKGTVSSFVPDTVLFKHRLFFCLNDFLAVVIAASLANTVSKLESTALRALYETRKIQLPCAGASLVSTRFRYFSLRYCHFDIPP